MVDSFRAMLGFAPDPFDDLFEGIDRLICTTSNETVSKAQEDSTSADVDFFDFLSLGMTPNSLPTPTNSAVSFETLLEKNNKTTYETTPQSPDMKPQETIPDRSVHHIPNSHIRSNENTHPWRSAERRSNPDVVRYQCPLQDCREMLGTSSHLTRHMRKHTGLRPYLCRFGPCERRFSRKDNMEQHYESHFKIRRKKGGRNYKVEDLTNVESGPALFTGSKVERKKAVDFWRHARERKIAQD
ncbi:transcriptional repressor [Physocladia obscura]|uniref:Transcriptional repressor n=1 Tax=Physocladia obscura TaxID=109957 RepID=A0AAD5XD54_9FUNG|nr:transcriptional repressor [Physocladia obscura]